ncbi:MAG: DNA replication/repair protein RecF, partial [Paracoccaceae bacterium]
AITLNRAHAIERVAAMQSASATAFPVAELSLLSPEEVVIPPDKGALAEALAQGRRTDLLAGRTLNGPHRADLGALYTAKGVPARDCSTGEQKALLISLILANARALALDFGAPPILLLDEVAAHLDADRRGALYEEICAIGAQAFMTGTGIELFEELGARAQFFNVTEDAGVKAA